MKTVFKRAVSVFCVLVTLFGTLALPASAATKYENDLPTVYLVGVTQKIYDENGKQVWPVEDIEDILLENSADLLTAFSASLMSSDWSTYGAALERALLKSYSPATLTKNGNKKNETGVKENPTPKKKKSNYGLKDYMFNYDPRLDPWATAYELKLFINEVLEATGKKKVNLIGRCLGGSYISAYLCRYGCSKVDTAIYYASAAKGSTECGELFSGKLDFDPDAINNYANDYMEEDDLSELLSSIVNVTYSLNMLGMGTQMVDSIFQELSKEVFPRIIRSTYATMPSYWAMVGEEYYDEAKEYIFSGHEEEHAGLINKIDRYHNNVKVPLEAKLKQFRSQGMKVAVIAKYNIPFIPLIESHSIQADGKISLKDISFGATGADIGQTLSRSYIEKAKKKGTDSYISDDLIIDASTCLFPEATWFVRDIGHSEIPEIIDGLMLNILRSKKQRSVRSFKGYPRYTYFDRDNKTLVPITEPIKNADDSNSSGGLFKLVNIFASLFDMIKNLFKVLTN